MPINRIHTLADGRRSYKITDASGKRHTLRSRKDESLKQFRARCDKLDRMIASPDLSVTMTLDELWDSYETQHQQVYNGPADNRTMRPIYAKHVQPQFGNRRITEITRGQISKHLTAMVEAGYSRSMVGKVRQCFSRPYAFAIDVYGLLITNPTQGLRVSYKRATDDPGGSRVISDSDLDRFLQLASGTKYYNYYRLLSLTGLRPSECLGLQRQDITLKHIEIRRKVSRDGIGDLKTQSARRQIPITPEIRSVLDDQLRRISGHSDWLFATRSGQPSMWGLKSAFDYQIRRSAVWQGQVMIEPALKISLYDFRHTFATKAADSGMPMHLLQRLLGHSDIQTTMRYYVHLTDTSMEQMADHMADIQDAPDDFGPNLSPIGRQTPALDANSERSHA